MKKGLICLMFICLCSCSPVKYITKEVETVRIEKEYIPDSIRVEIQVPYEIEKVVVPKDTIAIAQTSLALATAQLQDGMLDLEIINKNVKLSKDTVYMKEYITEYRDKIVDNTRIETEKVTPIGNGLLIGGLLVIILIKQFK